MARIIQYFIRIVFLFALGSNAIAAESAKADDSGIAKRDFLASKLHHGSPVIILSDKNFSKYITERPRIYTAVAMFTALGEKYQCSICHETVSKYEAVNQFYHSQYNFSEVPVEKQMIFFQIDVESSRNSFAEMGMETIPHIYVFPPREIGSPKLKISNYEIDMQRVLGGTAGFLEELSRLSNIPVVVALKPKPILAVLALISILLGFLMAAAARVDIQTAVLWYQHPAIWTTVSLLCFLVGVSGSIYCVIRSVPLFGYSRAKKGIEVFGTEGRDQYLAEGIIVGLWSIGVGLAASVLYGTAKINRFPVVRHVVGLLMMAVMIVMLSQLWSAYLEKTKWYSFKETIPAELWQFLTASVKKNSGMAKRLLRVSEVFLFEFKDWDSFQKKAYALVVDYFIRIWTEVKETYFPEILRSVS